MTTIDIDTEEQFSDHWQIIDSIKEKVKKLLETGALSDHPRVRSKKLAKMDSSDKEFVLQRLRGFLIYGSNHQPSYRLIWNEQRQNFAVLPASN